jgi:hypothetical protein
MGCNCVTASNHDPLNLIEAHFVAQTIVELCRACRSMVRRPGGSLFDRAAILEIGGDPVARNLWLLSLVTIPAAAALRGSSH